MKKILLYACLIAQTALFTTNAYALDNIWSCNYSGSVATEKTGNNTELHWLVKWTETATGWSIIGDNDDKYGHSWFDGNCANNRCNFVQTYKTGKLAGKSYYYNGDYTVKLLSKVKTTNTISGTWGYSSDNRFDGGDWNAIATCRKIQ